MEDVKEEKGMSDTDLPSFFIQDKEYKSDQPAEPAEGTVKSQAERELYEALQAKKNKKAG